jgi:sec-independent protein translocase protein TatB
MFGIGSTEFVIILIVALVLIGPQKLPDIMKAVGKGIGELRRMSSDVKTTIEREIEKADELKRIEETKKELFGDDAEQIKQTLTGVAESFTAAVADPARELMKTAEEGESGAAAGAAGNTELQAGTASGPATELAAATPDQGEAAAEGAVQDSSQAGQAGNLTPSTASTAGQDAAISSQAVADTATAGAPAQTASPTPQPSQEKTHA